MPTTRSLRTGVQIVALLALIPALVIHEIAAAARLLIARGGPRRRGDGRIHLVLPYPPGERSGASKAMQGLIESLSPGYELDLVPLYELRPRGGALRRLLADYLTNALPMPVHCRPFILSPRTVRERLSDDDPVLIEFLSGSLFLYFGRRPPNLLVLREHEPLCRRLLVEMRAAAGLARLLLAVKVAATWLVMLDVYMKVDRVVALTPEDASFCRRAFPWLSGKITDIPVSMELPPHTPRPAPAAHDLVFLGNFFHRPNVDALLWFLERCAPHLGEGYRLHLCGLDEPLRAVALPPSPVEVVRHGFVDDVDSALDGAAIAIAPVVSGAGVRMKNLYLGSRRMAIVTTPLGNEGIGYLPGVEAVVCDDAREMADAIRDLARHPAAIAELGERAYERVRAGFSHAAVLARFRAEVFT